MAVSLCAGALLRESSNSNSPLRILLFLSKFSWWGGGIPAKSLQFRLVKDSADFKTGKTLDGDYHYYAHLRSMQVHLLSEQSCVMLN